jgi:alkanesulfonate monooxygenase
LTVSVISSDFPGQKEPSPSGSQRSREVVDIFKQAWGRDKFDHAGKVCSFAGLATDPLKPCQTGGPLVNFGGYSSDALALCAEHCDVYLMGPEPKEQLAERVKAVGALTTGRPSWAWQTRCSSRSRLPARWACAPLFSRDIRILTGRSISGGR